MGRELVVGDRYKWNKELLHTYIHEVEWDGNSFIVVKPGDRVKDSLHKIYVYGNNLDYVNWSFIGNFSKVDSFTELYNLMNE